MLAIVLVDVDADRITTPPVLAPISDLATTAETVMVCRTLGAAKAIVAGLHDKLPRHESVCLAPTVLNGVLGRAERDTLRGLVDEGVIPVLVDQDGSAATHVMDWLDADLVVNASGLTPSHPDLP